MQEFRQLGVVLDGLLPADSGSRVGVTETMATQVPPSCASSYEAFGEESTSLSVLTVALGSCLDPIS